MGLTSIIITIYYQSVWERDLIHLNSTDLPFLHRPYPFKSIEENKRNWQTTNHKSVKEKIKKE